MTAITETTDKMMENYESHLLEGKEQWKAYPEHDDEDEVDGYHVFFIDIELDPIRVFIDINGIVKMPDDEHGYAIMDAMMLCNLAEIAEEIRDKHKGD
jgi:hypothetical protein